MEKLYVPRARILFPLQIWKNWKSTINSVLFRFIDKLMHKFGIGDRKISKIIL